MAHPGYENLAGAFPTARGKVPAEATRAVKIEWLRQYFLGVLCEDPVDGTTFDCDVLDALDELRDRYQGE